MLTFNAEIGPPRGLYNLLFQVGQKVVHRGSRFQRAFSLWRCSLPTNRLILFFFLLTLFLVQRALVWVCLDEEKEEENEKRLCSSLPEHTILWPWQVAFTGDDT